MVIGLDGLQHLQAADFRHFVVKQHQNRIAAWSRLQFSTVIKKVRAKLDKRKYPLKIKVTDDEMQSLNIEPHEFHGEWNYTIKPRKPKKDK